MPYRSIVIKSWSKFRKIAESATYRSWTFRGHSDASWGLQSTLSRYFTTFKVHPKAWSVQEQRILRIFRRKAHLLLNHLPEEDDSFQWLALMQHHGAPTRLLDFTWSPYVAAFFALERAATDAAIWALCPPKVHKLQIRTTRASQRVDSDDVGPWVRGNYEKMFLPNAHPIAIIGEPQRMNQRLIAQSGTFVMPGVLDKSIDELAPRGAVVKFILKTDKLRKDTMRELYNMNISNATLFPGLDGLARSLAYELEFHWAFDPTTMDVFTNYSID